jgi:glycosyltransferase involved in cell wall biosynthesis
MKIAFIYRGDPRHRTANRLSMFQNIAAAKRLGNDVVLITPREGMSATTASDAVAAALQEFGIGEAVPVQRIPRPTFKGRAKRSFDLLAACWARARGFDLIWSREFHAADKTTALGLNTVIEHHHPFTARQWKIARRMLSRNSFKGVAAISGAHKDILLSGGWPEDKLVVVHSGVDLSPFTNSDKGRDLREGLAASGQPLIVYAGSLYAGKGCEQVMLAARRLERAKFVCVGGRDHEVTRFREQVQSLGLTNIEFVGHVPHALVSSYLLAADILIAPFTEEARDIAGKIISPFSSPLKLFEYMAAGKPIVASSIGAIPEVITHDETGLLVEPGNVAELVGAISRLLNDRALAARLAKGAQRNARLYTWDKRVARVLEFASRGKPSAHVEDENSQKQCLAPVWKLRRGD